MTASAARARGTCAACAGASVRHERRCREGRPARGVWAGVSVCVRARVLSNIGMLVTSTVPSPLRRRLPSARTAAPPARAACCLQTARASHRARYCVGFGRRRGPSPGADVGQVPAQMWPSRSRRRCGQVVGPGADVGQSVPATIGCRRASVFAARKPSSCVAACTPTVASCTLRLAKPY